MDLFYYWKDFEPDIKAGRVGRFRSIKDRLAAIQEFPSDFVWVFRTPKGRKGQLQLLAKLRWSSTPPAGFKPQPGEAHIYYDSFDDESRYFVESDTPEAIDLVSGWVGAYWAAPNSPDSSDNYKAAAFSSN